MSDHELYDLGDFDPSEDGALERLLAKLGEAIEKLEESRKADQALHDAAEANEINGELVTGPLVVVPFENRKGETELLEQMTEYAFQFGEQGEDFGLGELDGMPTVLVGTPQKHVTHKFTPISLN